MSERSAPALHLLARRLRGRATARAREAKALAWLLRHVFAVDVTVCPFCEGRMRWLDVATAPDTIAELLARAGHGPRPPPRADDAPPRRRRPPRRRAPFGQLELDLRVG